MRKISNKEKIIYQNQNGKIIAIENMMFGGTRYIFFIHKYFSAIITSNHLNSPS